MKVFRYLYKKFRINMTRISPILATKIIFKRAKGKKLDLENPITMDEKIQWLKLYWQNPLIIMCADKLMVRDYVKMVGCEEILNELYGTYNCAENINFNELPNKFVLKYNHDCGSTILCLDKDKFNLKNAVNKLKLARKRKMHLEFAEMQYRKIKPRIMCEKLLTDRNGKLPLDYKFYCFNGKPYCVLVCVGRETGNPKFYFYDKDWNLLRINKSGLSAPDDFSLKRPDNISKMFEYAKILASPFPFVRVDLYDIDGTIYFGELTFTPAGGLDSSRLPETDIMFGNMIQLPSNKITGIF